MNLQTINSELKTADEQLTLLKQGRKNAAPRARESLLKIKKECDLLRKEVLIFMKQIPIKTKALKVEVEEPEVEEPKVEEVKVEVEKKKPKKK
jgi:hypothetical protein